MSPAYPRELGRAFEDDEVARNYRYRRPYPPEVFEILEGLLVEPRTVLDAGSGTGALTIGLARFAKRVDAIDPSAAMLREARRMPGSDDEQIRWMHGSGESAPLDPPYGLITSGASASRKRGITISCSIQWRLWPVVMRPYGESSGAVSAGPTIHLIRGSLPPGRRRASSIIAADGSTASIRAAKALM